MFRSFDPKKRRLIIIVLLAAALFVAAIVVPVVVVANYFQSVGKTEEPFSLFGEEPTQTQQVSPTPTLIEQAIPSQVQVAATPSMQNCTHTAGYWLNHQELWPALISVDEFNYTKEEAILRLQTGTQEVHGYLFLELHASLLNVLSGAEAGGVKRIMDQAAQWLSAHPERSVLTELEIQQGLTIAGFLRDFNNGLTGPGLCEGDTLAEATPDIATLFPTLTSVSQLLTQTTTATPTRTSTSQGSTITTRTSTPVSSGNTPRPPRPSATRTSRPPQSTNTQAPPPTQPPTEVPTSTPRPTQPPTPTSPPESQD